MINDKLILEKWLNPIYLQEEIVQELQKSFAAMPRIQLQNIFIPEKSKTTQQHFQRLKYHKVYRPDMYNYGLAVQHESLKPLLQFLRSSQWFQLIKKITKQEVNFLHYEVRSFAQGDYTLLHDERVEDKGVQILLDFTPAWNEEAGGYDYFTYQEDPIKIQPMLNALTIGTTTRHFTKYVNASAQGKKRYYLYGLYLKK